MATKTMKPDPAATLEAAEAELRAARAERDEQAERSTGTVERHGTRRVERAVVRPDGPNGRVEVVTVDEPVVERESLGVLERLRAKRALGAAQERLALAEEAFEEAKAAAARSGPAARAAAIAAGEARLRRALPELTAQVESLTAALRAYHALLVELDRALIGDRYFAELAGAQLAEDLLGVWLGQIRMAFPPQDRT
jgi:hypothetical protein